MAVFPSNRGKPVTKSTVMCDQQGATRSNKWNKKASKRLVEALSMGTAKLEESGENWVVTWAVIEGQRKISKEEHQLWYRFSWSVHTTGSAEPTSQCLRSYNARNTASSSLFPTS